MMSPGLQTAAFAFGLGALVVGSHVTAVGARGAWRLLLVLGFGPVVGLGMLSLTLFYWRQFGWAPPGPWSHLAVAAVLAASAGLTAAMAAPPAAPQPVDGVWQRLVPALLTVVSLLLLLRAFAVLTTTWPDGTWDAVAIWNVRAKSMFGDYWGFRDNLSLASPMTLPHYPLLVPGAIAAQYVLLGAEHASVPAMSGLLVVLAVGALVYAAVRREAGVAFGLGAVALLFVNRLFWTWGFGQVADVYVAATMMATYLGLASHLPGARGWRVPPLVTGFCIGLLIWSKNEGLILAVVALGSFVAVSLVARASISRVAVVGAHLVAGMVPGALAFVIFKKSWVPESGLDSFFRAGWQQQLLDPSRLWPPVEALMARLVPVGGSYGWGLAWPVVVAGAFLGAWAVPKRRAAGVAFCAVLVLAVAGSWIMIYATTPYDQTWHIASSLDRLMLQIFPVALAGTCGAVGASLADSRG